MKRAYVGNIPFTTTEEDLRQWFAPLTIVEIKIIKHHDNERAELRGKSRGFAFVEFATADDFEKSLWKNGQDLDGRKIVVNDAMERRRGVR